MKCVCSGGKDAFPDHPRGLYSHRDPSQDEVKMWHQTFWPLFPSPEIKRREEADMSESRARWKIAAQLA